MKDFLEPELRIIIFKTEDILTEGPSVTEPGLEDGDTPIV